MTQWVQHISGQGEKWEVAGIPHPLDQVEWQVYMKKPHHSCHWLPKSEYRLCEPPEVWVDVTAECEYGNSGALALHHMGKVCTGGGAAFPRVYRLRKIDWQNKLDDPRYGFIVEMKVPL